MCETCRDKEFVKLWNLVIPCPECKGDTELKEKFLKAKQEGRVTIDYSPVHD